MRICLVEDAAAADLDPLTLTRPVYDLLLGARSLGEKLLAAFGSPSGPACRGAIVRGYLEGITREREPSTAVNDREWLARGPVLAANARWVPPAGFVPPDLGSPWVGLCEGQPACAFVGPEAAQGLEMAGADAWFDDVSGEATVLDVGGEWIRRPCDLVARNADPLVRDFAAAGPASIGRRDPSSLAVVGPLDRLRIDESARIDPYTVFDTTNGPITVEANVWVQPFTRIEGPCHIGRGTHLFRANLRGGVTLGPTCRIGGEVEAAIVHGHSNKYHEGFLGHAYVGEWVNLGAITSNSDLRNDYGEVSVPLQGDPIPTGQAKVGCFIGDHTRTGMGSLLNTGTSIGVMCNVLPAGLLLPKHVPSFSAVLYGRVAPGFGLDRLFATARTVKERRGQVFSAEEEALFETLSERTRLERERSLQRHHDRRNERWPVAAASL